MSKKDGRHSSARKREIVEAYLNGEALHALDKLHDVCRSMIQIWIEKYERGEHDDDGVEAGLLPEYESRIAALERLVGRALEIEFLKGARKRGESAKSAPGSVTTGPIASRSKEGASSRTCPLSTFCADLGCEREDVVVGEITAITETRRGHGHRRVTAELRNRGMVVNSRKVRRITRENELNPKRKRRYVQTTDSDHDSPIYPNVARDCEFHGPDQLWVGDINYIAIATGFAYLAVILDAWSRKVVGYALGRNVDV